MTLPAQANANALPVHFDPEPFHVAARKELHASPLMPSGICLNPMCSCDFAPLRSWQRYCSDACRKIDEAEMRRVGHKAAPALLAWRIGKHKALRTHAGIIPVTPEMAALSSAGRAYVTRLQSEWYYSRVARASERRAG